MLRGHGAFKKVRLQAHLFEFWEKGNSVSNCICRFDVAAIFQACCGTDHDLRKVAADWAHQVADDEWGEVTRTLRRDGLDGLRKLLLNHPVGGSLPLDILR